VKNTPSPIRSPSLGDIDQLPSVGPGQDTSGDARSHATQTKNGDALAQ
jgi:hypothetical protein